MSFLYLQESNNLIVASATSLSNSGSADSNFPLSNLQVSQGWRMFKFDGAAADDTITADLGSAMSPTFCMIYFSNIESNGITGVELRCSTDNFSASDTKRADVPLNSPVTFVTFAAISRQYWRLKFVGTPTSTLYVGKWILGVSSSLTRVQNNSWELMYDMPQLDGGHPGTRVNLSSYANKKLTVDFKNLSLTQRDEMLALFTGSNWGEDPITVVPDSDDDISGLYGSIDSSWKVKRKHTLFGQLAEHNLTITEHPFPVIVK